MPQFSEADKLRAITAQYDPRKTVLVCGQHQYAAGGAKMPTSDCPDCWFAFLFHHIAQLPADKQNAKLAELEAAMHAGFELEDRGEFDAEIHRHPKIIVEKGSA